MSFEARSFANAPSSKPVNGRARWGASLWRAVVVVVVVLGGAVLAGACHSHGDCHGSEDCDCFGREECILGCYHDGCDLACSHTASACGAICENDCHFLC